jgi:hypothetical protein
MNNSVSYSLAESKKTEPIATQENTEQPQLYFNAKTNRWISKSCRAYREIIRDRELVKRGLGPGPKPQNRQTTVRKQLEPVRVEPEPETPQIEKTKEQLEHEDQLRRRDALFKRYGF